MARGCGVWGIAEDLCMGGSFEKLGSEQRGTMSRETGAWWRELFKVLIRIHVQKKGTQ